VDEFLSSPKQLLTGSRRALQPRLFILARAANEIYRERKAAVRFG